MAKRRRAMAKRRHAMAKRRHVPEALIARSHHDMGGRPAGKVKPVEHDVEDWERRVDAMMVLLTGVLGGKRLMTVDELRKNIEALGPEAYDRMSYYERWVTSITQTMIQRGVITTDELGRKMEQVKARLEDACRK